MVQGSVGLRAEKNNSTARSERRSRRAVVILLSLLLLVGHSTVPPVTAANGNSLPINENAQQPSQFSAVSTPTLEALDDEPMLPEFPIPDVTASSVLAIDTTRGALLYQRNADQPVAPASTLKMITAITALLVLSPDEVIQVSEIDLVDTTVYSNAALWAQDEISVRDLLAGLMIPSGGDAANALARVAGSHLGPAPGQHPVHRFVEEMNVVASSLGMNSSNFVNPDGPDHPEQYTTARDLAIAADAVMQDDLLAEIVAAQVWTITIQGPNARRYEIFNTNDLLGADRVHGVKTGTTGEAGQSVVLATTRGKNRIITVVMGSNQRYQDTLLLLQHIDSQVRWIEFGPSHDFPGIRDAADRFGFVLIAPFTEPIRLDDSVNVSATLELGRRPVGTLPLPWGYVVFLHDGEELYQVPVWKTGDSRG
jgi:serine-type D-Ala-D-Ala carboxypeptidase (penicillin-binding protein 5/6)